MQEMGTHSSNIFAQKGRAGVGGGGGGEEEGGKTAPSSFEPTRSFHNV